MNAGYNWARLTRHEPIPRPGSVRDAQCRPVPRGTAFLPDGRQLRTQKAISRRYPLTAWCDACDRLIVAQTGGDPWGHAGMSS